MSKNKTKLKEERKEERNEESEENESDENDIYQNQYIKATDIMEDDNYNNQEYEEQGIKINLAKIEERPTDEEESYISSIILTKSNKRLYRKNEINLKLKKILKYRNILYYYFNRWRKKINSIPTKKHKKIKKKKKKTNLKYNIGDNFIINEELNNDDDNRSKKKLKNSLLLNRNPNSKRIINNLKFFIENNIGKKALKKMYYDIWKESVNDYIEKQKKIPKSEQKYYNNQLKNFFDDDNNSENNDFTFYNTFNSGLKRKELKVKKNENINSNLNREIKKSFRIGQLNNNIIIKYENEKNKDNKIDPFNKNNLVNVENIKENAKNKDNDYTDNDINDDIESEKSEKLDKSGEKQEKRKGGKIKKTKKKKKSKKTRLKKIIEKINNLKLKHYYYNKWFNNCELNGINYFKMISKKIEDILIEDEKNNNSKENNSVNQEEIVIPLYPLYLANKKYNNNNYLNGNYNYSINKESKINTNTTKNISDNKENENNDLNISEEEMSFRDKKKSKKNNNEDKNDKNFMDNLKTKIDEVSNNGDYYNNKNNNVKNNKDYTNKNNNEYNNKKNNNKNYKKNNIIIKENEVPKVVKKRSNEIQNGFHFNTLRQNYNNNNTLESDEESDENNTISNNNMLSKSNDNYIFSEQNKKREENKVNNLNDSSNIKSNNLLNPINNSYDKKEILEEKKGEKKITDKKQRKLVRRYKKGFKLLRKVIKSRKKRNNKNFNPEVKMKYYFDLWISKSFPEGIDLYRKPKTNKNTNKNKLNTFEKEVDSSNYSINEKNDSILKVKLIKLIDIINAYIKRNKKIDLNQKDDLDKIDLCFGLWYNNVFDEEKNDEEEICETNSSITDENSFIDINKKIFNKNIINILSNKYNNKTKNKNNLNKNKNNNKNKYNTILKKLINLKENKYKSSYFARWKEDYPIEKTFTAPYLKPKILYFNEIQSPLSTKSDKKIDNFKLNDIKKSLNDDNYVKNENEINNNNKAENIKEKIKEVIIINTDINDLEKNNIEESFMKPEEKSEFELDTKKDKKEEEEEDEDEGEGEEEDDIDTFNKNKKENNNNDEKIKLLKIKNRLFNILEKINNKKKLYFYFKLWYTLSFNKKKEIENEDKDNTPRKIMSKIIKQFSANDNNNDFKNKNFRSNYKKRKNSGNDLHNNFLNFRSNKKRIIVKNELTDNRQRSKTLLSHLVGNISINSEDSNNDNDYENISEDIIINNSLKRLSTMNIKSFKPKNNHINISDDEEPNNNINIIKPKIEEEKDNYKNKMEEKEKEKKLIQNICDISQKNINLINKNVNMTKNNSNINLLNNEFKDKYVTLLKKNYQIMSGYQIFYLYSLFNERVDYYKLKYVFNKLKKEKI